MRTRQALRLAQMVNAPPRYAPAWLTPEMVVAATPLDGLDIVQRDDLRRRRVLLLCAVARTSIAALRPGAA